MPALATVTVLPTRRPRTEDNRGAPESIARRLNRAYVLLAALVGREWVSRPELDAALGCHAKTTLRNIYAAESVGLIEVHRARLGDDATRVRLADARLRRPL